MGGGQIPRKKRYVKLEWPLVSCLAVAIVYSSLTCLSDPNLEVDIDKLNKEFMEQSEVGLIHRDECWEPW